MVEWYDYIFYSTEILSALQKHEEISIIMSVHYIIFGKSKQKVWNWRFPNAAHGLTINNSYTVLYGDTSSGCAHTWGSPNVRRHTCLGFVVRYPMGKLDQREKKKKKTLRSLRAPLAQTPNNSKKKVIDTKESVFLLPPPYRRHNLSRTRYTQE